MLTFEAEGLRPFGRSSPFSLVPWLGHGLVSIVAFVCNIYKKLYIINWFWGVELLIPEFRDVKKSVIRVTLYSALHSIDTTRCDWIQRRVILHNIQCDCNVTLATVSSPYILPLKIGHWYWISIPWELATCSVMRISAHHRIVLSFSSPFPYVTFTFNVATVKHKASILKQLPTVSRLFLINSGVLRTQNIILFLHIF